MFLFPGRESSAAFCAESFHIDLLSRGKLDARSLELQHQNLGGGKQLLVASLNPSFVEWHCTHDSYIRSLFVPSSNS